VFDHTSYYDYCKAALAKFVSDTIVLNYDNAQHDHVRSVVVACTMVCMCCAFVSSSCHLTQIHQYAHIAKDDFML
jgi:hypothetical protein